MNQINQKYVVTFYILDADHNVVCVHDDLQKWGEFFESGKRHVAFDTFGNVDISTVFLGIDHGIPRNSERPILFETMIFRDGEGDECWRCATWKQAEAQHNKAVELVRRPRLRPDPSQPFRKG